MDHIGRLGYALLAVEAVVGAGTWIPGIADAAVVLSLAIPCLLYTSPSPRDRG